MDQWTPLSQNLVLQQRYSKINLITFWTGSDVYSGVIRNSSFHYIDQKPKGKLREKSYKNEDDAQKEPEMENHLW